MIVLNVATYKDNDLTTNSAGALKNIAKLLSAAQSYLNSIFVTSGTITVDLAVSIDPGTTQVALGTPANTLVNGSYVQAPLTKFLTGSDINGFNADATLSFSAGSTPSLNSYLNDGTRAVTGNAYYIAVVHELGHILGFGGMRSTTTGTLPSIGAPLSFDKFISVNAGTGKAVFTGANARLVYGSDVPLKGLGLTGALYHFDEGASGLGTDFMGTNGGNATAEFSMLDMAVFKDLGYTITKTLVSNDGHTFLPGAGAQTITGTTSTATDTVIFDANRASYTIERSGGSLLISSKADPTAAVSVSSMEVLRFADAKVDLSVGSIAGSLPSDMVRAVEELYVAYFNRVPDADGMSYWLGQLRQGKTIDQIGQAFYDAGLQLSAQTGYTADMSNSAFVTLLYKNVLGRPSVDDGGLKYWMDGLASGSFTRGTVVNALLTAAHTYQGDASFGWVASLLDNKLAVAHAYAVQQGLSGLTADASYAQGAAIAAAVTPTSTDAALQLIGVAGQHWYS